jgi:hypothetical protein
MENFNFKDYVETNFKMVFFYMLAFISIMSFFNWINGCSTKNTVFSTNKRTKMINEKTITVGDLDSILDTRLRESQDSTLEVVNSNLNKRFNETKNSIKNLEKNINNQNK